MSWHDAQAYCTWRYPQNGSLPTEAQWEIAARGGGQYLNVDMTAFQSNEDLALATAKEKAKYATFPWGETLLSDGTHMSNVFQVISMNSSNCRWLLVISKTLISMCKTDVGKIS